MTSQADRPYGAGLPWSGTRDTEPSGVNLPPAIRTLRPGWLLWPVNRPPAGIVWRMVRRNARADRDILCWMRPVDRDLRSAADGPSVRAYRRFCQRNLPADAP
ncbi:hypothetical protein AQI88_00525 [Streptomyces cellostaticus]|uniref:Uncharacterized protein n=1 Tax=Streptomyces cellostaticus TaxID=67285 RepID=A0A101NT31_9ACTN|nr:hypothetical protein [Streptomyces cellostaticus]KUM98774.1 hypothetical protein AQI88_00525 [Streptomyces cellostaticus]GHI03433.1 hypothetical protein Scel_17540 [Streptomyces cellostaticus]